MENQIKRAERKIGWYVLGALVVLVAVFFAGTKYAINNATSSQQSGTRMGVSTARGLRSGNGAISGVVIKKDEQSITVQAQDGSARIVFIDNSTKLYKTVLGIIGDIAIGSGVFVNGNSNSDGSITGLNIQLRNGQEFMMR